MVEDRDHRVRRLLPDRGGDLRRGGRGAAQPGAHGAGFGLEPAAITTKILLPGALPGVLSGARIATSIALILVVAAEMIGAERGIGALILRSAT